MHRPLEVRGHEELDQAIKDRIEEVEREAANHNRNNQYNDQTIFDYKVQKQQKKKANKQSDHS